MSNCCGVFCGSRAVRHAARVQAAIRTARRVLPKLTKHGLSRDRKAHLCKGRKARNIKIPTNPPIHARWENTSTKVSLLFQIRLAFERNFPFRLPNHSLKSFISLVQAENLSLGFSCGPVTSSNRENFSCTNSPDVPLLSAIAGILPFFAHLFSKSARQKS